MRTSSALPAALACCALAAILAGCAASIRPAQPGPPIPAPALSAGDRWVYQASDGFRTPIVWEETHVVTAAGPGGITVDVTLKGPTIDMRRTERLESPGVVLEGMVYDAETSKFDPPLIRFRFPLTVGERWSQRMRDQLKPPGPFGPIMRSVTVAGYETVTVPAGTFDAMRLDVLLTMDDETFWRWPTQCEYSTWYAEKAAAMVQEVKRCSYRDKGGLDAVAFHPAQNSEKKLVSFSRR